MSFGLDFQPKGPGINCILWLLGGVWMPIPSRNGDAQIQVMRHRANRIWS
jgi:hypothetical protein